ncbi:MAG: nucleotidyltransferase domain-containing protein [Opitutae bacterium]|nr:nucleotidyltransferase domain-containing protein [Opitutae bacterium]
MIPLLHDKQTELTELCRKFGVERLYVFGSAASGEFSPLTSDIDFLVRLAGRQPTGAYADRYLNLADGLERLFGRRVDLVTEESVRNPHFRSEVETTRQLVYDQSLAQAAV